VALVGLLNASGGMMWSRIHSVIDDIASYQPWKVRGIEIRGEAELHLTGGEGIFEGSEPAMIRIIPKRIVSWGIDTEAYGRANARSVNQG
jgi:pyridoxamine 5'-phosphate oxidase family protein